MLPGRCWPGTAQAQPPLSSPVGRNAVKSALSTPSASASDRGDGWPGSVASTPWADAAPSAPTRGEQLRFARADCAPRRKTENGRSARQRPTVPGSADPSGRNRDREHWPIAQAWSFARSGEPRPADRSLRRSSHAIARPRGPERAGGAPASEPHDPPAPRCRARSHSAASVQRRERPAWPPHSRPERASDRRADRTPDHDHPYRFGPDPRQRQQHRNSVALAEDLQAVPWPRPAPP